MTYWTFGSVFKVFQILDGPIIYTDASCAHVTSAFATKFRKSLWKLFYKQEIIKFWNEKK